MGRSTGGQVPEQRLFPVGIRGFPNDFLRQRCPGHHAGQFNYR